jgi:hypothetical protein
MWRSQENRLACQQNGCAVAIGDILKRDIDKLIQDPCAYRLEFAIIGHTPSEAIMVATVRPVEVVGTT